MSKAEGSEGPSKKTTSGLGGLWGALTRSFKRQTKELGPVKPHAPGNLPPAKPAQSAAIQRPPQDGSSETPGGTPYSSTSLMKSATAHPDEALQGYAEPATQPMKHPILSSKSGEKINVMVVDDIAQTRETIIRTLRFQTNIDVIGVATTGAEAVKLARDRQPDVILMDVNMPDMDGITATHAVMRECPNTQVIILTVQDDVDYMRRAMQAGARDFLTKPPVIDELIAAVEHAGEYAQRLKSKPQPAEVSHPTGSLPGRGKVVSLYSPKGGVGRTTLAVNLAIALHSEETPVVIIDGNLQFGDVPVSFNVNSKNTVIDLAARATELDPEIVEEVLIAHSTGIKLLAPTKPELAESVSGEQFHALLKYLSKLFTYVIVDASPELTDITLAALDASDLVLLVTTQEIPTLADLSKFMDLAPMLKLERQKTLLTLNQYDRRINITPEKVSQYFRQEVAAVVPSDPRIVLPSINRGVPFMLEQEARARPVGQAVVALSKLVRKRLKELAEQAEKEAIMAVSKAKQR